MENPMNTADTLEQRAAAALKDRSITSMAVSGLAAEVERAIHDGDQALVEIKQRSLDPIDT
jgi:hypothetical protein